MPKPRHEQADFRGQEIVADEFTGKANVVALSGVVNLTDSSAGTATNAVVAIPAAANSVTDTAAATTVSVNAALAAIRNDFASLTAKVNAILTALK